LNGGPFIGGTRREREQEQRENEQRAFHPVIL
jgi:hypothetical protein